jgi:guanosine-diphosphatase
MLDSFPSGGILALSYFYDRINPLMPSSSSSSSLFKRAWGWGSDSNKKNAKSSKLGTPNSLPISEIAHLAQRVCAGPKSWDHYWGPQSNFAQSFQGSTELLNGVPLSPLTASAAILKELEDRPEYCLDLTFMHGLLRLGYEFGSERSVRFEKKVDNVELGWCLGATIAMLLEENGDAGLKCIA